MKLTCVTAVRNAIAAGRRDALVRCVGSVAQLETSHEHLVYDGASTDGTAELLRKLEATTPGLKVVSEPDTGIYNALNKGVRDARGEWFYVLGCDDCVIHPAILDRLIGSTSDDIQAIVSPVERNGRNRFFKRMKDLRVIFRTVPYSHQGLVMKTSTVRRFGGFDERNYRICADWDLMFKAHESAVPFRYAFEPFALYATGGASETSSEAWQEVTAVLQNHLGMTDRQTTAFRNKGLPPASIMIQFVFHPDTALRTSARYMLLETIKRPIRPFVRPIKSTIRSTWSRLSGMLIGKQSGHTQ